MEIKKPINKSLSIQVANELEKQIANGTWKVGSKIPSESELMSLFGVSRNTLREAIRFLVISGVLDTRQGDGTYIITETVFNASIKKRLEQEKLSHILETRIILEPHIVEMASIRRTDQEMIELKKYHEYLLQSFEVSWGNYVESDIKFHRHLAKMCHNPLLEDLYRAISEFLPQYITENFLTFCDENIDLFLHKNLVTAIEKRDKNAAREITERMLNIEKDMLIKPSLPTSNSEE